MGGESSAERVALVTGGTRGIGLGIARALAREGCRLALCGCRGADEDDILEVFQQINCLINGVGDALDRYTTCAARDP